MDINRWIKDHADDDVSRLRLRYHGDAELMDAVTQVECRRRCRSKLPELLKCDDFRFPSVLAAEQCTSELLARYHAGLVAEGARVLDLTCGLGVDAFTMARRVAEVTVVEIDPVKARCAGRNAAALGLNNVRVVCADAVEYVRTVDDGAFDAVYIDPARRGYGGRRLFSLTDCSPDVVALMSQLRRVARKVIVKASPMLDVAMVERQLPGCGVTVLGTPRECLEVVAELGGDVEAGAKAVTLGAFDHKKCDTASGPWLYELWPAEMKLGRYAEIERKYDVTQISGQSHLFRSERFEESFPGNIYAVVAESDISKRSLAALRKQYPQLNVSARGVGMTSEELRRKVGVKDGGVMKLFGVSESDGRRRLILCSPVSATLGRSEG